MKYYYFYDVIKDSIKLWRVPGGAGDYLLPLFLPDIHQSVTCSSFLLNFKWSGDGQRSLAFFTPFEISRGDNFVYLHKNLQNFPSNVR